MSYKIIRHYQNSNRRTRAIKSGLTLEQAQAHCRDPNTHGKDWFDGYDEENARAPTKRKGSR